MAAATPCMESTCSLLPKLMASQECTRPPKAGVSSQSRHILLLQAMRQSAQVTQAGVRAALLLVARAGLTPQCRNTFLYENPSSNRLIMTEVPEGPKPGCMVCGKAQLTLRLNTEVRACGAGGAGHAPVWTLSGPCRRSPVGQRARPKWAGWQVFACLSGWTPDESACRTQAHPTCMDCC